MIKLLVRSTQLYCNAEEVGDHTIHMKGIAGWETPTISMAIAPQAQSHSPHHTSPEYARMMEPEQKQKRGERHVPYAPFEDS
jgi:hypothetical protein